MRRSRGSAIARCGPALLSELAQQPGLIDEYIVIVHPAAIGAGDPLFAPLAHEVQLAATDIKRFEDGAVALRYRPVGY